MELNTFFNFYIELFIISDLKKLKYLIKTILKLKNKLINKSHQTPDKMHLIA